MYARRVIAALALGIVLAGAIGAPAMAQMWADRLPAGVLVGISPDAVATVVQIMTEYTLAIGAGFAGGGVLMSLFTGRAGLVVVGGVAGAVAGNLVYANYLRSVYNHPLGLN